MRRSRSSGLSLQSVPRPVRDAEAAGHLISRLMVTCHRCRGRPGEVVVEHPSQSSVIGESGVNQSLVEASDRTAIHFVVLPVAAVHLDDSGFVTLGIGVCTGATECLRPVCSEALDMLRMETVAEGMTDHLVGHYPMVPSFGKTA